MRLAEGQLSISAVAFVQRVRRRNRRPERAEDHLTQYLINLYQPEPALSPTDNATERAFLRGRLEQLHR